LADESRSEDQQSGGDCQDQNQTGGTDGHSREKAADPGQDQDDALRRSDPEGVVQGGGIDQIRDGRVRPKEVDDPEEVVDAEIVDRVARRVNREFRRIITSYSGPLPQSSEFGAYEQVLPGAADRIMSMAEKALDAQVEIDKTLAEGDTKSVRRGQWQSTGIVTFSLAGALVAVLVKAPWEAVAVFGAPGIFEFGSSLIRAIREPRKSTDDDSKKADDE
jgi:uncharacterized membrane protein